MAAQGLTKEEKDKLVDQRVAAAREKNEAIKRRQKLIEEERKTLGEAAAPPSATLGGSDNWRKPDNVDEEVPRSRGAQWPGENTEERVDRWDKKTPDRSGRGRGDRGHRAHRGGHASVGDKPTEQNTRESQSSRPFGRGRGRGALPGSGRLPGHGRDSEYEKTRKENAVAVEKEMKNSVHMPGHSSQFLSDASRSSNAASTNEEDRLKGHQHSRRHPRNYGGDQSTDLREKIKRERHRKSGDQFNPNLHMTGKERLEHDKWKTEQQKYDEQRVERAKSKQGGWRREWDANKETLEDQNPPPEYGIYREIDNKKSAAGQRPEMRGVSNGPKGRGAGRGRGRGRATPIESTTKHEDKHKLEVTIDTKGDNPHTVVARGFVSPNKPSQVSPQHRQGSAPSSRNTRDAGNYHSDFGEKRGGGYRGGGTRGGRGKPAGDGVQRQPKQAQQERKEIREPGKHKVETRPPMQSSPKKQTVITTTYISHSQGEEEESQEIIVTEDDDEWVDVDSDEESQTEEETTPHVSKDNTPTPKESHGSKEDTPTASDVAVNGSETASKAADTLPAKPQLHIDIRDPVDDIFKTPEEGRKKLDWAAEMEDASPVTDVQLHLTS